MPHARWVLQRFLGEIHSRRPEPRAASPPRWASAQKVGELDCLLAGLDGGLDHPVRFEPVLAASLFHEALDARIGGRLTQKAHEVHGGLELGPAGALVVLSNARRHGVRQLPLPCEE